MLVLTRRTDETLMIGNDITITVLAVKGDQVRIGIKADAGTPVHRKEVAERIAKQQGSLDEKR